MATQKRNVCSVNPLRVISASPSEENMRYFTRYGGVFKLELFLPEEYPMAAPKVTWKICLDILKDKWSPALQIRTVLLSIQALLSAPNPDDPLSENIAKHWKSMRNGPVFTQAANDAQSRAKRSHSSK
ncbi:hypothetical protein HID58_007939 [Brassica napus]|uniref:UBC core domain-containing protein n=1 Tax=Brassica napus TaxID=3708 RepID=A0ABQ7XKM1_BRANA|nr:hypothetical protein HID58_007939 [Brassica napus]